MRIAFPLIALLLVLLVRPMLEPWMHVSLFSLALPLLSSLAVIRVVFFVLRYSFVGATWLTRFERIFAARRLGLFALHITGLLPVVIGRWSAVGFQSASSN